MKDIVEVIKTARELYHASIPIDQYAHYDEETAVIAAAICREFELRDKSSKDILCGNCGRLRSINEEAQHGIGLCDRRDTNGGNAPR